MKPEKKMSKINSIILSWLLCLFFFVNKHITFSFFSDNHYHHHYDDDDHLLLHLNDLHLHHTHTYT